MSVNHPDERHAADAIEAVDDIRIASGLHESEEDSGIGARREGLDPGIEGFYGGKDWRFNQMPFDWKILKHSL